MRLVLCLFCLIAPYLVLGAYTPCTSQTLTVDNDNDREDVVAAGASCELTLNYARGRLLFLMILNSTGTGGTVTVTLPTGNTLTYDASINARNVYIPAPLAKVKLTATAAPLYIYWSASLKDQTTHAVDTTEALTNADPNIFRQGSELENKLTVIRAAERIIFYPLKDPDHDFTGFIEQMTRTIIYDGEGVSGTALATLYDIYTNPRPWYQSTQTAITILDLDGFSVSSYKFIITLLSTVDPGGYSIMPYGYKVDGIRMNTASGYSMYSIYGAFIGGLYLSSLEVPTGVGKNIDVYAGGPPTTTSASQYHLFSFSESTAALWTGTNLNMPLVTFVLPAGADVAVGLGVSRDSSAYQTNGTGLYVSTNYPTLSTSTDATMQKIDFYDKPNYDQKKATVSFTFTIDSIDDGGKLALLVNGTETQYDSSQKGQPITLTVYDTMNISYKAPQTAHRGVLMHYDVSIHGTGGSTYYSSPFALFVVIAMFYAYC